MRRVTILAAVVVLAAAFGAGTASAAPVRVALTSCYFNHGGNVTVPAGSDVTVFLGVLFQSKGVAMSFENAQTTTATLNGSAVPNAGSLWAAPVANPNGAGWVAPWFLSVGTLANAGNNAAVTLQVSLSHKIPVGVDPSTGEQTFIGPDNLLPSDFGCTITAT